MKKKTTESLPETLPTPPWYRVRRKGVLYRAQQILLASSVWWANVPLKSIMSSPGNVFQPAPLGDKYAPSPLRAAKVVAKFSDKRAVKYAHLSTGTVVRVDDKVESKDRRHRNEVSTRAANLRNVRH